MTAAHPHDIVLLLGQCVFPHHKLAQEHPGEFDKELKAFTQPKYAPDPELLQGTCVIHTVLMAWEGLLRDTMFESQNIDVNTRMHCF